MKKRIAIKIGSNVLALKEGGLDLTRIKQLVSQVSALHRQGFEIIMISSGAVAAGRALLSDDKLDAVSARQLFSAIGQAKLINHYHEFFAKENILCGQVLTTKESLGTRSHYLNQRNCMEVMLQHGVVPIVNENDTISVTELMFTDNDELSGLVAEMVEAEALVILTNVDGVYDGPPDDPASKVIPRILPGEDLKNRISAKKTNIGRGGMISKYAVASRLSEQGIRVIITHGNRDNILPEVLNNPARTPHTEFVPAAVHQD